MSEIWRSGAEALEKGHPQVVHIQKVAMHNLTFSSIKLAIIDGRSIANPNWNMLLKEAVAIYYNMLLAELQDKNLVLAELEHGPTHIQRGEAAGKGFQYMQTLNLSVQGEDANDCWQETKNIAEAISRRFRTELDIRVKVHWKGAARQEEFVWRPANLHGALRTIKKHHPEP